MSDQREPAATPSPLPEEILDHYDQGKEAQRLFRGIGSLERIRIQELVKRFTPPPPAVVFDIGGGPGSYACWLAREGYTVYLIDAVPLHVEQARKASSEQPDHPLADIEVGDARKLDHPDASADVILLFGPLYHLLTRKDRLMALKEVKRVLRDGGITLATSISRFASTLVALQRGWIGDPVHFNLVEETLTSGRHLPPDSRADLFTTAYFHHPDELKEEVKAAGLIHMETLAVQGPGWLWFDFPDRSLDPKEEKALLKIVRRLEREPALMGVSAHNLVIAKKANRDNDSNRTER